MPAMTIAQALQAAVEHHQAGRLGQAEAIYRQILAQDPNQPDALHLLGVIAARAGQHAPAEQLVRRAIAVNPGNPSYHNSVGLILKSQGRVAPALDEFRRALRLNPADAVARRNLADTLV